MRSLRAVKTDLGGASPDSPVREGESGEAPPRSTGMVVLFLLPALLLICVFLVYPTVYSLVRSLFDRSGTEFVGLHNYVTMFTETRTLTALRNTGLWVLVAPATVTGLGLVLAVLTERIRWATAFRLLLFVPMAISLFASGIVFRLVYAEDPDQGVANAAAVTVHDMFTSSSEYPGARPREEWAVAVEGGHATSQTYRLGEVAMLPVVGVRASELPDQARAAIAPDPAETELRGVVWLDASIDGEAGEVEAGEMGMPRVSVQALREGTVVATTSTGDDGQFTLPDLAPGSYTLRLAEDNFAEPFRGLTWLGPALITPAIISSWIWIMTGFAVTLLAAGLAAIPRDTLEAARVDGATEWQVFRKVKVPLLAPLLIVVFVTLVINALKIFDLVFVIAPGSAHSQANVLAVQMWQVSFGAGGDQGFGSALVVLLLLLVLPVMLFNIRRFRRERS